MDMDFDPGTMQAALERDCAPCWALGKQVRAEVTMGEVDLCSDHAHERADRERQQQNDAAVDDAQERAWEDNEARRIGLI
jgi:hypothetical protein